jgi:glyoxylase-like metal-dependent hydrolase (beta-lactamase superfamily II)
MEVTRIGGVSVVRVPFDGYVGRGDPPNAYFVAAKPLVLVDSGIMYPGNLGRLAAALETFDFTVSEIDLVVLTHWHWDHTGLAREIADRSGAKFFCHASERVRLFGSDDEVGELAASTRRFYASHGFDRSLAASLTGLAFDHERVGVPVERVHFVRGGEKVPAGGLSLEVFHAPGHTPGALCLFAGTEKVLFSSDTVYGRLFPHPVVEIPSKGDQTRSVLREYPATLRKLGKLGATTCFPGHGAPFSPAQKVIAPITSFIERRLKRLERLLAVHPLCAAEVMAAFFPNVSEAERYHAVAEVVLLLEVLEFEGRADRTEERGVFKFVKKGPF